MPAFVRKCAGEPLAPQVDPGASPNHELSGADGLSGPFPGKTGAAVPMAHGR